MPQDATEAVRRATTGMINEAVASTAEAVGMENTRALMEAQHGQVWNSSELQRDFEVLSFCAPCVVVRRKSDQVRGTLYFSHSPRFYYNFQAE